MKLTKKMSKDYLKTQIIKDKAIRMGLSWESLYWFFVIYFSEYIKYLTAAFQMEMFDIAQNEAIKSTVITAFRGPLNPSSVSWNKDDSLGSLGNKKAQVNINNPDDTYTLTGTVTNSEGSATDSVDLSWGYEEPEPESEADETSIAVTRDVSGYIYSDGGIRRGDHAYLGDSDLDTYTKGYLSFDISGLHGKTVQDAEINFTRILGEGEPSLLASEIVVKVFNYVRLDNSDFAVGGVQLPSIPISAASYTVSGNTLKNELQNVLDNEVRDYFQLKLGLNVATNNDGSADGVEIYYNETVLYISYTD